MAGRGDHSFMSFVAQTPNERTAATRAANVRSFTTWLGGEGIDVLAVTEVDAYRYLESLKQTHKTASRTTMLRSLRAYYVWLLKKGLVEQNPFADLRDAPQDRQRPPKFVPPEDIKRMLDASVSDRNWAFLSIVAFNSLRVGELLECGVADFQEQRGGSILHFTPGRRGDHRRPNFVVLASESTEVLKRYLGNRRTGPLFTNDEGTSWSRSAAAGVVFMLTAERAKLAYRVTPDMVSNSLAVAALRQGFSYRGLVRAIGVPDRRFSERWLTVADGPDQDNASMRFARLVLNPPETPETTLLHVESVLYETDLPGPFTVMAAGAVFERHLRELCLSRPATAQEVRPNPKDGTIKGYVDILHRHRRITLQERHVAEQVGEARNNAAHGAFELLAADAASETLRAVRKFVSSHPLLELDGTSAVRG